MNGIDLAILELVRNPFPQDEYQFQTNYNKHFLEISPNNPVIAEWVKSVGYPLVGLESYQRFGRGTVGVQNLSVIDNLRNFESEGEIF